jgi:hypothetical protein
MTGSFAEIRNKYLATFVQKAEDIQSAWDEKDMPLLNELIHKLSGSSGGYGFDDLCTMCQKTMRLIDNTDEIDRAQVEINIQQISGLLRTLK